MTAKLPDTLRKFIPGFLKGKEKAIVAFIVPIILAQLAHFLPGVHFDATDIGPIVEQVIGALIVAVSVHQTTNVPAPPVP